MIPLNINPLQWHQAMGYARQSCARVFRDGGCPGDAMQAFGVSVLDVENCEWDKAVEAIAQSLCSQPVANAA